MSRLGCFHRVLPVGAAVLIAAAALTPTERVALLTDETPLPAPAQEHLSASDAPPSAAELTSILHSAVNPGYPLESRLANVERGEQAVDVMQQISSRAGKMMRVVSPRVIDPIEYNGSDEATGRLQVTLGGSRGPTAPLQLTFKKIDGRWVISARSICDVASFNGFSCPPGYAD